MRPMKRRRSGKRGTRGAGSSVYVRVIRAGLATLCAIVAVCAVMPAFGQAPAKRRGPSPDVIPELLPHRAVGVTSTDQAWRAGRSTATARGPLIDWDNGAPLDNDIGGASSQLSEMPPDPDYAFISAGADDFIFNDAMDPVGTVQITRIRVAFTFFGENAKTATPTTTWTGGVFVTIYPNDPAGPDGNQPAGEPDQMGGQTGAIVHQLI